MWFFRDMKYGVYNLRINRKTAISQQSRLIYVPMGDGDHLLPHVF
jgi:hypothetical protein